MIIEDENFLNEEELKYVDSEILSEKISWYYHDSSTSDKFPYFGHIIIPRYENKGEECVINSVHYDFFSYVHQRFCDKHEIPFSRYNRQSLNLTYPNQNYTHGDIHLDHHWDHKTILIYLNDDFEKGETLIFNEKPKPDMSMCYYVDTDEIKNFTVKQEIKPKKGKAVCLDCSYYHTVKWHNKNRRVVYVGTFD